MDGLVRERFEKALPAEVAIPLQSELLMLAVEFEQGDIVAAHDGARELLDGHVVVAPIERSHKSLSPSEVHRSLCMCCGSKRECHECWCERAYRAMHGFFSSEA
jgi:hypothetical protein